MSEAASRSGSVPAALQAAADRLRDDPAEALAMARAELETGESDPRFWIVAGHACRAQQDWDGVEEAADALLDVNPDAILGLIWKADCLSVKGEARRASPYYAAALRAAAHATGEHGALPEATRRELQRVEQELQNITLNYDRYLADELEKAGFGPGERSERFESSLRILMGGESADLDKQRPSLYFYPGLPQREFYAREEFEWAGRVEAQTGAVREELQGVLADPASFTPYVVGNDQLRDRDYHGMKDNEEWTSFFLWQHGRPVPENIERCPRTAELMESLPLSRIPHHTPSVLFSRLTPGAHIPAHFGMVNCRLICHLPLIVPDGCRFRVGNERRNWEEGKLLIFDDTIEHEAWNEGEEDRIILLFDIARPEIDAHDHRAIAAVFEAIENYR